MGNCLNLDSNFECFLNLSELEGRIDRKMSELNEKMGFYKEINKHINKKTNIY